MKEQPANPVVLCSGFTGSEAWRGGDRADVSRIASQKKIKRKMQDFISLQHIISLYVFSLFKYFHHHSLPFFSYLTFTGQLKNGSKESTLPCLNVLEGLLEKVFHSPLMKNVCGNL